jgi:hypothetical protein
MAPLSLLDSPGSHRLPLYVRQYELMRSQAVELANLQPEVVSSLQLLRRSITATASFYSCCVCTNPWAPLSSKAWRIMAMRQKTARGNIGDENICPRIAHRPVPPILGGSRVTLGLRPRFACDAGRTSCGGIAPRSFTLLLAQSGQSDRRRLCRLLA